MEDLCLDSVNMHEWFWVSWIFCPVSYLMTQAFGLKQVVSQLPFSSFVCIALLCFNLYASVQKRVHRSCMPRKRHEKTFETLLQTKERLTRELRLRTERRIKELLESEQLTVTEDEAVSYDTDPQELHTGRPRVAVPSQVTLILVACFLWISVVAYLNWFNRNHTCYRI